jgi:hypothetical protein
MSDDPDDVPEEEDGDFPDEGSEGKTYATYRHTNSSVIQTSYFYIDGPEDDLSDASGNYQDVSDEPEGSEGSEGPVSDDEDAPGSEEGSEGPSEGPSEEGDSDDAPGSDDDDEGPEGDDGNHVCHCSECVREC